MGLLALFLAVLFMLGDVFWFEPLRPSHLVRFISGSFVGAALAFLLWGCAAVLWTTDERRRNHETAK